MIRNSFLILALIFVSVGAQANTCSDIFKTTDQRVLELANENIELSGIKLIRDTSPQEIKSKKDPGYRESLKNLLMMLTETQYENIDKKLTFQRGDLRLGKVFDDGLSLEFIYEGDIRGNNDFFYLKKIKLIKPNGKDQDIDDNPVPDIGMPAEVRTIVVKKERSADETATITALDREVIDQLLTTQNIPSKEVQKKLEALTSQLKEVKVPYKIEGVLLESLKKWSDYIPNLKRSKIRDRLEQDKIIRLVLEAQAVRALHWTGRQLNRIIFKDVIRAALALGLAYSFISPTLTEKTPAQAPAPVISIFPKQEKIVIIPNAKSSPIILVRAENPEAYDLIADQMEDSQQVRR